MSSLKQFMALYKDFKTQFPDEEKCRKNLKLMFQSYKEGLIEEESDDDMSSDLLSDSDDGEDAQPIEKTEKTPKKRKADSESESEVDSKKDIVNARNRCNRALKAIVGELAKHDDPNEDMVKIVHGMALADVDLDSKVKMDILAKNFYLYEQSQKELTALLEGTPMVKKTKYAEIARAEKFDILKKFYDEKYDDEDKVIFVPKPAKKTEKKAKKVAVKVEKAEKAQPVAKKAKVADDPVVVVKVVPASNKPSDFHVAVYNSVQKCIEDCGEKHPSDAQMKIYNSVKEYRENLVVA
jgi:RNase P protein component